MQHWITERLRKFNKKNISGVENKLNFILNRKKYIAKKHFI